jgi:hypothetical protein
MACLKTTIPAVTKLQASRSRQIHKTLQHEQRSSGELNILRYFSLRAMYIFSGGKARPGRDAVHSLPSSAEVKNE